MRRSLLSGVAISALIVVMGGVAGDVLAADLAVKAPPAPVLPAAWSWAGFYIGTHSAAYAGSTKFDDPFGPSIFGDRVTTPGYGSGGQIGYNWQFGKWVYGLETDATWLTSGGTNTCGAFSGFYSSANCGAKPDAMGTVTARVGVALGPEGHTLAYAKGGFAWQHNDLSVTNNFNFITGPQTNSTSLTQAGWTVGAGVEQALTPAWSVKFEYDYMNFGHHGDVTLPASWFGPVAQQGNTFFFDPRAAAASKVSSDAHVFKLGLNYKIGEDPWSTFGGAAPLYGKARAYAWAPGWEFEGGGRYWYSWGRFQKDLPNPNAGSDKSLVSRLTYENTANTGEFFGRVDTPVNIFLKGYVGGGSINRGHMNDEDWGLLGVTPTGGPALVSYSNTISNSMTGPLFYGTIDLGYDFLRGPGYKAGAFVGYNRYSYTMNAGGCVQIANPFSDCTGSKFAPAFPTSQVTIVEDDTWDSLRVGASAETVLFDRWKLSGDVAYIPYTHFTGTDQHLLRNLVISEQGHGQGVQADVFLNYYVTDAFSVGVGGRYWALWTTSGSDVFSTVGLVPRNDTFRTERTGVTFQASYKF
jgi:opacity protein-like surface antigen/outer membrane protease